MVAGRAVLSKPFPWKDAPMQTSIELTLVQPRVWQVDGDANFAQLERHLAGIRPRASEAAVVVLPELVGSSMARARYCSAVSQLAARLDRWVIGGSHHWDADGGRRNAGVVVAPTGDIVAAYEKRHPFGAEIDADVGSGAGPVVVDVGGVSVAAMICADFWHSECVHQLDPHPDVIAVASFSISRGRAPGAAKELWRHLAVTRAWEHGVHVGISDWSPASSYGGLHAVGLAASASPAPTRPAGFITGLGNRRVQTIEVDIDRLRSFRADQHERGMFASRAERLRARPV
jgi:predicted amidohydrolase